MTHHGFIASLSTSALMVGSALAVMLIASAILAFEGWPGPSVDAPANTVLIDNRSVSATGARPQPDVVFAPAGSRSASADGGSSAAGGSGASTTAADGPTGAVRADGGSGSGGPAVPGPVPGTPDTGGTPPGGGADGGIAVPVDEATGAVEGAVGGAVEQAAPVIDRLGPVTEGSRAGGSLTDGLGLP